MLPNGTNIIVNLTEGNSFGGDLELIIIKSCNHLPLITEVSNNMYFVTLTCCLPAQFMLFI
jgi:hypothetical protein